MKAFPLVLIAVLCLGLGWFAHYTVVPKTTIITDTLRVYDTTFVRDFYSDNGKDSGKAPGIRVYIPIGWRHLKPADDSIIGVIRWKLEDGTTEEHYFRKDSPILGRMMSHGPDSLQIIE